MKTRFNGRKPLDVFSAFALLFIILLSYSAVLPSRSLQVGTTLTSSGGIGSSSPSLPLSADEAGRLIGLKLGPGYYPWEVMDDVFPTLDSKRPFMDYFKAMGAEMIMINYKRLPSPYYPGVDQLESPVNSGKLNPKVLHHMDEWVQLGQEYGIKIIFEDWFSPKNGIANGEWTGFDDWTFHQYWANFYKSLTLHYKGNTAIAGFLIGEEVMYEDVWPYTVTGSAWFNDLWNQVMTLLSKAVHSVDPDRNIIVPTSADWTGGIYTLGSKAMYPNAWKPLNDSNPHILYRVMWNPKNAIKTDSLYPFDGGLLDGAINWHQESGQAVTVETLVTWKPDDPGGVFQWDSAGLQWFHDLMQGFRNYGVGGNPGERGEDDTLPYVTFYSNGVERAWVQTFRDFLTA